MKKKPNAHTRANKTIFKRNKTQKHLPMKFILIAWRKCPERVKSSDEAIYPICVLVCLQYRVEYACVKVANGTESNRERAIKTTEKIFTCTAVDRLTKIKNYRINVSSINKLKRHICGAKISFTCVNLLAATHFAFHR